MDLVCPLCRSGRLTPSTKTLDFGEQSFPVSAHDCPTCRETLLTPQALAELKQSIRNAGLGASDAEIDTVVERLLLRAE
ncbi:MAG: hypothetical protein ACREQJ_00355 [Candidatus Binatia bacterium]